jgi:hypothetical protein
MGQNFKGTVSRDGGRDEPLEQIYVDIKTGSSDPADFATTRIRIRTFFVAYRSIQSPICQFYIYGCAALWPVALKRLIFKREKLFANLSLGLYRYYCSIGPYRPPSRDTVPILIMRSSFEVLLAKISSNKGKTCLFWFLIQGRSTPLFWSWSQNLNRKEPRGVGAGAAPFCRSAWVTLLCSRVGWYWN